MGLFNALRVKKMLLRDFFVGLILTCFCWFSDIRENGDGSWRGEWSGDERRRPGDRDGYSYRGRGTAPRYGASRGVRGGRHGPRRGGPVGRPSSRAGLNGEDFSDSPGYSPVRWRSFVWAKPGFIVQARSVLVLKILFYTGKFTVLPEEITWNLQFSSLRLTWLTHYRPAMPLGNGTFF